MFLTAMIQRLNSYLGRRQPDPSFVPAAWEEEAVFRPVQEEIYTTYARFLFRHATAGDVTRHLDEFCDRLRTPEQRLQAVRDGRARVYLGIRPLSVEIDLTNQCNLRCVMCHFSDAQVHRRRRQDIAVEEFARIAAQVFPLCQLLNLSFGTEPLLHHHFCDLLAITRRYEIPGVYAVTNGLLLDEPLAERIIGAAGLDSLTISIDAATAATYERIRTGGCFNRLLANIQTFNRLKDRLGANRPVLDFNFVLMRSNIAELPAVVRLAHSLNVRRVTAIHMVPYRFAAGDTRAESLFEHQALCDRMLKETAELAGKLGVAVDLPNQFLAAAGPGLVRQNNERVYQLAVLDEGVSQSGCYFPWHWVGIDPHGRVNPCGWWYEEEPMGDLRTQTFEEIWNGEPYQRLRAEHRCATLRATCRACPAAGLGNVSSPLAYLTRKPTGPAFLEGA